MGSSGMGRIRAPAPTTVRPVPLLSADDPLLHRPRRGARCGAVTGRRAEIDRALRQGREEYYGMCSDRIRILRNRTPIFTPSELAQVAEGANLCQIGLATGERCVLYTISPPRPSPSALQVR